MNAKLGWLTRRQHGLFTRTQALACGFTHGQIRWRVRAGTWRYVVGQVLCASSLRLTRELRDRAANLAIPGSALAGPSAARLWGIDVPCTITYLVVTRRVRPVPSMRLIRAEIDSADLRTFDGGLTVVARERAIFDCLWLLSPAEALELLDRALLRRWLTVDELARRLHGFTGRHGVGQVVALMRAVATGHRYAAERLAGRLLRAAGIRGWVPNLPVYDECGLIGIGDLVFPKARLVVEIDGMAYHVTPESFQRDRERQNRLVAAGWTVLRFTWSDLTQRPELVVRTILGMLRRGAEVA